MEILNLIFRLGVLFSIYGFLWFFIDFGLKILVAGRTRSLAEVYLLKSVQYLFLVNVTFLFCLDINQENVSIYNLMPTALILLMFFVGKFQQQQRKVKVFGSLANNLLKETFNKKAEIILITVSVALFISLLYFPQYANNRISNWFHDTIIEIEKTVFIGFIFKIIGFFFLVSMLIKMLNAIVFVISGKPFINIKSSFQNGNKNDNDKFDDFEEVE